MRKQRKKSKAGKRKRMVVNAFCEAGSFDITEDGNGATLVSQCWAYHVLKDYPEMELLQKFGELQKYIQHNLTHLIKAVEEKLDCNVNTFIPPEKSRLERISIGPKYQDIDADEEHITTRGRRNDAIIKKYGADIKKRKPEMLPERSRHIAKLLLGNAEAEVVV